MLIALLVIRLKGIRSNSKAMILLAAGVSLGQLSGGLALLTKQPSLGFAMIFMAIITVVATVVVYSNPRPQRNNAGEEATKKIEKMIVDYNQVLLRTTDIVERQRIKSQIDKLKGDLKNGH